MFTYEYIGFCGSFYEHFTTGFDLQSNVPKLWVVDPQKYSEGKCGVLIMHHDMRRNAAPRRIPVVWFTS
jgi:hypothetical protein